MLCLVGGIGTGPGETDLGALYQACDTTCPPDHWNLLVVVSLAEGRVHHLYRF